MPARKKAAGKKAGKTAAKRAKGARARKAPKGGAHARKPAPRRAARAKPAALSMAPRPVKTGSGPGPFEVAREVTALLREGRTGEVEEKWLAPGVESVEGHGASLVWTGKKAVLGKYRGWEADHEIHEMKLEGPWVGATGFALKYWVDVTQKSTGQRSTMEEIGVYTVRNGKIVREEFHFATGG
jgi:hypothetical protein